MSKEVKARMEKPTETAELKQEELTDSGLTVGNLRKIELGLRLWVTVLWFRQFVGPLVMGLELISIA